MYTKEYKVVCDRTEYHSWNGKVIVKKGVMCLYKGDYCKRYLPIDDYQIKDILLMPLHAIS